MLLLKLMSDSSQTVVTWPAVAFDVRITRDLVSVVHAVAEDTIGNVQYHSALLTCIGHFLYGSLGTCDLLPHFERILKGILP